MVTVAERREHGPRVDAGRWVVRDRYREQVIGVQQGGESLPFGLDGERPHGLERDVRMRLEHQGKLHQRMLMPPSTTTAAPVMNAESVPAKNRATRAISSCVP